MRKRKMMMMMMMMMVPSPSSLLLLVLVTTGSEALRTYQCASSPLGLESGVIADEQLSASSSFDDQSVGPQNARLRTERASGAWCPKTPIGPDSHEFLAIDLGALHLVTALETQGRWGGGTGREFAGAYFLEYRRAETEWIRYRNRTGGELLDGNRDTASVVARQLDPPIVADKIRLVPWAQTPRTVCLRAEVHGCPYKEGLLYYWPLPPPAADYSDTLAERTGVQVVGRNGSGDSNKSLGVLWDGLVAAREPLDPRAPKGAWLGWRVANSTAGRDGSSISADGATSVVQLDFEFDTVRNFSYMDVVGWGRRLDAIDVLFGTDSRTSGAFRLSSAISSLDPTPVNSTARRFAHRLPLHHRIARRLRLKLTPSKLSEWIFLTEIHFQSSSVGNLTIPVVEEQEEAEETTTAVNLGDLASTPDTSGSHEIGEDEGVENEEWEAAPSKQLLAAAIAGVLLVLLLVFVLLGSRKRRRESRGRRGRRRAGRSEDDSSDANDDDDDDDDDNAEDFKWASGADAASLDKKKKPTLVFKNGQRAIGQTTNNGSARVRILPLVEEELENEMMISGVVVANPMNLSPSDSSSKSDEKVHGANGKIMVPSTTNTTASSSTNTASLASLSRRGSPPSLRNFHFPPPPLQKRAVDDYSLDDEEEKDELEDDVYAEPSVASLPLLYTRRGSALSAAHTGGSPASQHSLKIASNGMTARHLLQPTGRMPTSPASSKRSGNKRSQIVSHSASSIFGVLDEETGVERCLSVPRFSAAALAPAFTPNSAQNGLLGRGRWTETRLVDVAALGVCALKVPRSEAPLDLARNQLLTEARLLGQISHSQVIRLLGVVEDSAPNLNGGLLLEAAAFGDVRSWIRSQANGNIGLPTLLHFVTEAAAGCAALAERSIVHGHLSPAVWLLTEDMRILIAAPRGRRAHPAHLRYSAPESIVHNIWSTPADVWAWATSAAEVLEKCRRPPLAHLSHAQIVEAARRATSGSETELALDYDPTTFWSGEIRELLDAARRVDPAGRPLFQQIVHFLRSKSITAQRPSAI